MQSKVIEDEDRRSRGGVIPGSLIIGWALPSCLYALLTAAKVAQAVNEERFGTRSFLLLSAVLWAMFFVFTQRRRAPLRRNRSIGSVSAALGAAVAGSLFAFTGVASHSARPCCRRFVPAGRPGLLPVCRRPSREMFRRHGRCPRADHKRPVSPRATPFVSRRVGHHVGNGHRRAAYLLAALGLCLIFGLQVARAMFEEQTVAAAFPEYSTYKERVRASSFSENMHRS